MDWEITFEGITYSCVNCAYCCSCRGWKIYLNYFDKLKLGDYDFAIDRCDGNFKYMLKTSDHGCVLLKDNLCRVHLEKGYEFKPLMCRIFPFSCMVKWDGTPLLIIKHYCRGIKTGETRKEIIDEAIYLIKELYFDSFEDIIARGMEYSSKTEIYEGVSITWEEREEFGRYIFGSKNFNELYMRCIEIFGHSGKTIDNYSKKIRDIIDNLIRYDNKENESEILRYLLELNRREHFRKLPFYLEVNKLLDIAKYLAKFKNIFEGEGEIDRKLFLG